MTPEQIKELSALLRPYAHKAIPKYTKEGLLALILHTLVDDAKQKKILLDAAFELAKAIKEEKKEIL